MTPETVTSRTLTGPSTVEAGAAERVRPSNRAVALLVLALLFVVYHANFSVLDEGDAVPSINLPLSVLETGRLSIDAEHFPEMFKWKSKAPLRELTDFYFISWNDRGWGKTMREWKRLGNLEFNGPRYYIVKSPRRGTYVSTFGPIPGLFLLPMAAPFYALDHDLAGKLALKTSVAKLEASLLVSACAAMLFLIAARRTTRRRALIVAFVYGLGTCAWAISSQNIWQQTVNQFLLTAGAFFLLGNVDRRSVAALSGLALGAATACRATGAVMLVAAFAHLFVYHRKSALAFFLGSLPVPFLIAVYNWYYFGSPLVFAQELVGHVIAQEKTGSPALWQTPLLTGVTGLLTSPSRGLLVFSPVLLPAFYGAYRASRDPAYRAFRPLIASALVTMVLQCKWFDWWGGWAYGYRPWLDAVPYLTLLLLPALDAVVATTARRALFGAAFAWSVFVQAVGALTYDRMWNMRTLFVVRVPDQAKPIGLPTESEARNLAERRNGIYLGPTTCDIDYPFCRHRLWSLDDNMIWYHVTHFREARGRRLKPAWDMLGRPH